MFWLEEKWGLINIHMHWAAFFLTASIIFNQQLLFLFSEGSFYRFSVNLLKSA